LGRVLFDGVLGRVPKGTEAGRVRSSTWRKEEKGRERRDRKEKWGEGRQHIMIIS